MTEASDLWLLAYWVLFYALMVQGAWAMHKDRDRPPPYQPPSLVSWLIRRHLMRRGLL
jgi:hypothetical protein